MKCKILAILIPVSYTHLDVYKRQEVQHPGVYQLERHANVEKAIKASGGLTKQADISGLNLTMDIEHHGVLVVPSKHRITKISINAATLEAVSYTHLDVYKRQNM